MIIGQVVDKLPSVHLRRADPSLLDSDTLLGVEVEVEGCKKGLPTSNSSTGYWLSKEDHSLREGGREFVFAEPLFGADAVAAINYLCDEAIAQKWVISERTGIHVHMDMRNMEVEKFQNFCILYALTERLIYGWVGEGRDKNIHCLPWYMADGDIDYIGQVFRNPKEALPLIKNLNRYSGLNLASLATFGTAEFRQLKTTFNKARILMWINIILSLKKAAIAWQGKPNELIREMRLLGAFGFTNRVFGNLVHHLWYADFSQHFIGTGIPVAQTLLKNTINPDEKVSSKRIQNHLRNETDERGEHPGFARWKAKRKTTPKKTVDTPFGQYMVDDGGNLIQAAPTVHPATIQTQSVQGGIGTQTFTWHHIHSTPPPSMTPEQAFLEEEDNH